MCVCVCVFLSPKTPGKRLFTVVSPTFPKDFIARLGGRWQQLAYFLLGWRAADFAGKSADDMLAAFNGRKASAGPADFDTLYEGVLQLDDSEELVEWLDEQRAKLRLPPYQPVGPAQPAAVPTSSTPSVAQFPSQTGMVSGSHGVSSFPATSQLPGWHHSNPTGAQASASVSDGRAHPGSLPGGSFYPMMPYSQGPTYITYNVKDSIFSSPGSNLVRGSNNSNIGNVAITTTISERDFSRPVPDADLQNPGDLKSGPLKTAEARTSDGGIDFIPAKILSALAESRCRSVVLINRPAEAEAAAAAASSSLASSDQGTGFLVHVAADRMSAVVMTNNHVLPTPQHAADGYARFNFVMDEGGGSFFGTLDPSIFFITSPNSDEGLDCTLIGVSFFKALPQGYDAIKIPSNINPAIHRLVRDSPLMVIHHPHGLTKQFSPTGQGVRTLRAVASRIWYSTGTRAGSSGAPVFDWQWTLVALHSKFVPATLDGDPTKMKAKSGKEWVPPMPLEELEITANEGVRAEFIFAFLNKWITEHAQSKEESRLREILAHKEDE
jgi:hypothetical protein